MPHACIDETCLVPDVSNSFEDLGRAVIPKQHLIPFIREERLSVIPEEVVPEELVPDLVPDEEPGEQSFLDCVEDEDEDCVEDEDEDCVEDEDEDCVEDEDEFYDCVGVYSKLQYYKIQRSYPVIKKTASSSLQHSESFPRSEADRQSEPTDNQLSIIPNYLSNSLPSISELVPQSRYRCAKCKQVKIKKLYGVMPTVVDTSVELVTDIALCVPKSEIGIAAEQAITRGMVAGGKLPDAVAGGLMGAASKGFSFISLVGFGVARGIKGARNQNTRELTKAVTTTGGGIVGGYGGGVSGAVLGSMVLPGAGTVVGGIVGAGCGGWAGAAATEMATDRCCDTLSMEDICPECNSWGTMIKEDKPVIKERMQNINWDATKLIEMPAEVLNKVMDLNGKKEELKPLSRVSKNEVVSQKKPLSGETSDSCKELLKEDTIVVASEDLSGKPLEDRLEKCRSNREGALEKRGELPCVDKDEEKVASLEHKDSLIKKPIPASKKHEKMEDLNEDDVNIISESDNLVEIMNGLKMEEINLEEEEAEDEKDIILAKNSVVSKPEDCFKNRRVVYDRVNYVGGVISREADYIVKGGVGMINGMIPNFGKNILGPRKEHGTKLKSLTRTSSSIM